MVIHKPGKVISGRIVEEKWKKTNHLHRLHGHRSWSFIDLIRSPFLKILKSFSLSISFHLFSSLFISFHLLPVSFTCSFQALTAEELAKVARRPQVDPKLRRLRAASCPAEWPWDVWFKFQVIPSDQIPPQSATPFKAFLVLLKWAKNDEKRCTTKKP